jgi:hypothetical protein
VVGDPEVIGSLSQFCQIAKSLADDKLVPEYRLMGSHGDSIGTGNIEVCHLGPREARAPKSRVHF